MYLYIIKILIDMTFNCTKSDIMGQKKLRKISYARCQQLTSKVSGEGKRNLGVVLVPNAFLVT